MSGRFKRLLVLVEKAPRCASAFELLMPNEKSAFRASESDNGEIAEIGPSKKTEQQRY